MNRPAPGRVRIIGGRLRNSKLPVADAAGLRPTPERVRETLFNWLAPVIDGARCLDLYAGTGALGIEAVSRGAAEVVFVERDRALADALRANLARLGVSSARVEQREALSWLAASSWEGLQHRRPSQEAPGPRPLPPAHPHAEVGRFDIVFVDPPFAANAWNEVLAAIDARGLLARHGFVYVESPHEVVPVVPGSWTLHREGRAGDVRYALYRRA